MNILFSQKNNLKINNKSGYALLFAMIVASIVLALGVSLLTVGRKEFILSSSATQSSGAFYAADSGLDCAEYWDSNGSGTFATTSYASNSTMNIQCTTDGASRAVTMSSDQTTFTFYTQTSDLNTLDCAAVTVQKVYDQDSARIDTTVISRGYNIGWNPVPPNGTGLGTGDCSATGPKKLERAIELTY
jgi:Tfp pilus assembly protein PilX